jgi:hypothetical protein
MAQDYYTFHVHFILVNSEFNMGVANDLHQGEETEDNIKHLWEDELAINEPVVEMKISHNQVYKLQGFFSNQQPFSFDIPEMTIIESKAKSGAITQFAVSKKLIKETEKIIEENKQETHFYFYLKDKLAHVNPMNGIYILKKDFPQELQKP